LIHFYKRSHYVDEQYSCTILGFDFDSCH